LPKPELDLGGRKFSFFLTDSKDYASLVRIAALASEGKIKPVFSQGRTFPFTKDAWAELMAEANSGRAKGKLVMSIIDEQ
jgi:NADPH:quinone reductase-like Zn-dependent oxidoreductase